MHILIVILLILTTSFFSNSNEALLEDGFDLTIDLRATALNEDRTLHIKLPANYSKSVDKRYPVLYLLDGQNLQSNTAFIYEFLAGKKHIPEMIIVSIPHTGQRTRDYYPYFRDSDKVNEGADHFLHFLEEQVIPYLGKHYRTSGYRLLAGHSGSGLFVYHSLVKRPQLFNARFAFSPSLHHTPMIMSSVKTFFQTKTKLNNYFYTNVGGSEFFKITNAFQTMENIFDKQGPAGLRYHFDFNDIDGHQSTPFIGMHLALKRLYGPTKVGNGFEKKSKSEVIAHYDNLSIEFGEVIVPKMRELQSQEMFNVLFMQDLKVLKTLYSVIKHYYPNSNEPLSNAEFLQHWLQHGATKPYDGASKPKANLLNNLGYNYLGKDNTKSLYLLKLATTLYSDRSNPFDSYGEALEYNKNYKQAAKMYEEAYKLAVKNKEDSKVSSLYKRNLERVRTKLN